MRFRHPSFFSFFCFLLLSVAFWEGCEYHTDQVNFQDVKIPDTASIAVVLDPSDTVYYLSEDKSFVYHASSFNRKVYNIKVFVDTTKVAEIIDSVGSFWLGANDYQDGLHKLTMVATTSTGSGSLADYLGSEGFVFSLSWDLIVNKNTPGAVQITKIFNDKGILRIEWEEFHKEHFIGYGIFKTYYDANGYGYTDQIASIYQQKKTYSYDSNFFGGEATYQVIVFDWPLRNEEGEPRKFVDDYNLKPQWIEEDLVKLEWEKCRYPAAFKEYRVYQDDHLIYSSSNIDSVSFRKHSGIIGQAKYKLVIVGTGNMPVGQAFPEVKHSIGFHTPLYNAFHANSVNALVFLSTNNSLYRFNTDTRQIVDSITPLSYNSQYVLAPQDNVLIDIYAAKTLNPGNLSETHSLNIDCHRLGSVSNNGLGIILENSFQKLYDFINLKVVSTFTNQESGSKWFITEDGKYYFYQYMNPEFICCKIVNGQAIKQWTYPNCYISLIPGEPDKVLLLYNNICEIRRIETNEILSSFAVDAEYISGIDPLTHSVMFSKMITMTENELTIYNFQTGQKLREFKAFCSYPLFYFRGSIYSPDGFEVPVNL